MFELTFKMLLEFWLFSCATIKFWDNTVVRFGTHQVKVTSTYDMADSKDLCPLAVHFIMDYTIWFRFFSHFEFLSKFCQFFQLTAVVWLVHEYHTPSPLSRFCMEDKQEPDLVCYLNNFKMPYLKSEYLFRSRN